MYKGAIAIVGGGIGGIAAGAALLDSGYTIRVFERADDLREAGAGIVLWPTATGILGKMGALSGLLDLGQCGDEFRVRSASGELFMNICTAADTPTVGVQRAHLLRALAALVPAECLYTKHDLAGIEFAGERVRLRFGNGETFMCDGVVGADGIHSRIRTGLLGARGPSYRGYAIFRGVVDTNAELTPAYNGESWGSGRRFGILRIGKNRVCWYATANTADPRLLAEDRKGRLERLFRGWHDPIPDLIAATQLDAILLNSACDAKIRAAWSRRPVTLLGDAAHALTPNLGQGACMAIEDAFVLGHCLRQRAGVREAFRRYESLRFHHVRNTILRSRWIGRVGQWESLLAVAVRDAVTRLLPARMFECHTSLEQRLASLCGAP